MASELDKKPQQEQSEFRGRCLADACPLDQSFQNPLHEFHLVRGQIRVRRSGRRVNG